MSKSIGRKDTTSDALARQILAVLEKCGDTKLRDLKDCCGDFTHTPSSRKIRKTIEALRDEGKPIGSSARRGYFLIRTQRDWKEAVAEFRAKAMACLKMKARLERIGTELFTDQQRLDFVGAEKGQGHGSESAGDQAQV